MKALAVDCASSKTVITCQNESESATVELQTGAMQSKQLLPAIDFAMKSVSLLPQNLDFSALSAGPGTFTGLRIAFSALKALTLSYDVPIFAISSLLVYAFPFEKEEKFIVPVLDAKKNQFFASVFFGGKEILSAKDTSAREIADFLKTQNAQKQILTVGPDSKIFANLLNEINPEFCAEEAKFQEQSSKTLLKIAQLWKEVGKEPLKDYDGPIYMRKSEAELSLVS